MELSFKNVFDRLREKKKIFIYEILIKHLDYVFNITKKITSFLKKDNITGFEKSNSIATNPLLWELGHIYYFYDYHCLRYLLNKTVVISDGYIYDSFKTDKVTRFNYKKHSKEKLFQYMEYIEYSLYEYLRGKVINHRITYLILLVILHNHMHCESFLFTSKLLGYSNPLFIKYNSPINKIKHQWIKISGGKFNQGTYEGEYNISFDNEMPFFEKKVEDFEVLDMLVTEQLVLEFIQSDGYFNNSLWSNNGNIWKEKNNINLPMYWSYNDNRFSIQDFNITRRIIPNYPACHISWYEAEAICKWLGGRLPTESEWEYMATNGGKTKFPWGDIWKENIGNLNYSGHLCNVDEFQYGNNNNGVIQLFGNVWEWCQESFYPYDGFRIDPVYREFSYPFFGYKKILKGGCWAVPEILINPKYRNAQMPDMRMQFTGIRVVK